MKKLHVKATFIEPVLGTWPANPNVAREFIASKSPDAAFNRVKGKEPFSSGNCSTAGSSGNYSTAGSSGYYSTAGSSGDYSTAGSSGNSSTAAATGACCSAKADGKDSISVVNGVCGKACGALGCYLVLTEYDDDGNMLWAKMTKVDGAHIKEKVWYTLKNGEFVEAEP